MQTVITSKFQTTIPKKIREKLLLSVKDTLNWEIEDGRIIVSPMQTDFLKHKNSVRIGPGAIKSAVIYAALLMPSQYSSQYPSARSTRNASIVRAFSGVHHAPAIFRRS